MKIDSEKIKDLLKYARERHGAPCRVEVREMEAWDDEMQAGLVIEVNYRDSDPAHFDSPINCEDWPLERILI